MVSLSDILLNGLGGRWSSMRPRFDMSVPHFQGWGGVPLIVGANGSVGFLSGVESDAPVQMRYVHGGRLRSVVNPLKAQQGFIDRVAALDATDPEQRSLAYSHPSMSPTDQDVTRAIQEARETGRSQVIEPRMPSEAAMSDSRYSTAAMRGRLERDRSNAVLAAERVRRVGPDDAGSGSVAEASRGRSNPLELPLRGEPAGASASTGASSAAVPPASALTSIGDEVLDDGSIRLANGRIHRPRSEEWNFYVDLLSEDEAAEMVDRAGSGGATARGKDPSLAGSSSTPSKLRDIRQARTEGILGGSRPMGVDPAGYPNVYGSGNTGHDIFKAIGDVPENVDETSLRHGRGRRLAILGTGAVVGTLGLGYGAYRYLKGKREESQRTDMAPVEPNIPRLDPTGNAEIDNAVTRRLNDVRGRYASLVEDKYDDILGPNPSVFQDEYDAYKEWTRITDPADLPPIGERRARLRGMFGRIEQARRKWDVIPPGMTDEDGAAEFLAMAMEEADVEIQHDIQDVERWRAREVAEGPAVQAPSSPAKELPLSRPTSPPLEDVRTTVADDIPPLRARSSTAREVLQETLENVKRRPRRGLLIGAGAAGALGLGAALHGILTSRGEDSRQDMNMTPRELRKEIASTFKDEALELSTALYNGIMDQMDITRTDMAKASMGSLQQVGKTIKSGLVMGGALGTGLVLAEMIKKSKGQLPRMDMALGDFTPEEVEAIQRRWMDQAMGGRGRDLLGRARVIGERVDRDRLKQVEAMAKAAKASGVPISYNPSMTDPAYAALTPFLRTVGTDREALEQLAAEEYGMSPEALEQSRAAQMTPQRMRPASIMKRKLSAKRIQRLADYATQGVVEAQFDPDTLAQVWAASGGEGDIPVAWQQLELGHRGNRTLAHVGPRSLSVTPSLPGRGSGRAAVVAGAGAGLVGLGYMLKEGLDMRQAKRQVEG